MFLPFVVCRPSPPSLLGCVIFCQPIQCIFLSIQRNPTENSYSLYQCYQGAYPREHCIIYTGIVKEDAWTRIVLPTKGNRLAFQPASFCLTLSRTKLKSWLLDPQCLIGKPRYLPRLGVEENPKMSQKASRVSLSTLGEKKKI